VKAWNRERLRVRLRSHAPALSRAHVPPLSPQVRQRNIERLQTEVFDVLVVGGGINGAAVARDAAMRGLRVAMIEKGDFASGTSSKSSKLIHGGIRYLQHGDLRLVRVACRERDLLRRQLAPHLVAPLAFLFPVYRGDPVGIATLGLGMWLYDLLAVFRNIRVHRMLSAKRLFAVEPGLRQPGLRGAALYYDCFTDDARLTIETVLAAHEEGAVVTNYLELKEFTKQDGRIVGAVLQDRRTGAGLDVRARCTVNVTGPWADRIRQLDDPAAQPFLRLTKGAHIIVPHARLPIVRAIVMHSPRDKRVLFAIPWNDHALIGTTDTDFNGSQDDVQADEQDIDYLLEAANWFFPSAKLGVGDVVSSFAGLRPLVADGDTADPSAVSREEQIFEAPSGLITLGGGKLTTHRLIAAEIVDIVAQRLGLQRRGRTASRTASKPLPGGRSKDPEAFVKEIVATDGYGLTADQIEHLARRYGSRTIEILDLLKAHGELRQPVVPGMPDILAEAVHAAQAEMALQPEDVLLRRTQVGVKEPATASQAADLMKEIIYRFGMTPG
jgi:glycerol-3-phosphate dehydrogenase